MKPAFSFAPGNFSPDEDDFSTASTLKSKEIYAKKREDTSSFTKELAGISLLKELRDINPLKELKPLPPGKTRFSKLKARSNSPIRDSLGVIDRNHLFFPGKAPGYPGDFSGLDEVEFSEYEEDEEMRLVKEMYCKMIQEAQEPVAEETITAQEERNASN